MGIIDVEPATDLTSGQRARLVHLAAWAAGEDAKRRLGLRSEWYQGTWFHVAPGCGTACCIAGKVALEDGAVPVITDDDGELVGPKRAAKLWNGPLSKLVDYDLDGEGVYPPGSTEPVEVANFAQEALGLTGPQAMALFDGSNDLEDVLRVVAALLDVPLGD